MNVHVTVHCLVMPCSCDNRRMRITDLKCRESKLKAGKNGELPKDIVLCDWQKGSPCQRCEDNPSKYSQMAIQSRSKSYLAF